MAEALGMADFVKGFDEQTPVLPGGIVGLAVKFFPEPERGDQRAGTRDLGLTENESEDGDIQVERGDG